MNLVHHNPQRRMHLHSNGAANLFDNIFDGFFSPVGHQKANALTRDNQQLKVDIYEKGDAVIIDAELPGVDKENISVDVKGKSITLSAERANDNEIKGGHSYRQERQFGQCTRTFNLPFELSDDTIKATYKNGLLKLEITKPTEQVTKKIDIN